MVDKINAGIMNSEGKRKTGSGTGVVQRVAFVNSKFRHNLPCNQEKKRYYIILKCQD